MTATLVNDMDVVATHPIVAPISKPDRPVYYRRIVELELSDGSRVIGCVECDHVTDKVGSARIHLRTEHPEQVTHGDGTPGGWKKLTLGEAVKAAGELERVRAELYAWRTRAQRAEQDLATIKRVMRGE